MKEKVKLRLKQAADMVLRAVNRFFDQNKWMRVVALLAAIIMWVAVMQQKSTDRRITLSVPLEITGEDSLEANNLVLLNNLEEELPDQVQIRLDGTKGALDELNRDLVYAQLDLSGIRAEGSPTIKVNVLNSSGITWTVLDVATVSVEVRERHSARIPVRIEYTGEPGEGYRAIKELASASPANITMYGSKEDLDEIEYAKVVVDLSEKSESVESHYSYLLLDSEGNEINKHALESESTSVIINCPVLYEKVVDVRINEAQYLSEMADTEHYEYKFTANPAQVTICGLKEDIEDTDHVTLYLGNIAGETSSLSFMSSIYEVENSSTSGIVVAYPEEVETIVTITELMETINIGDITVEPVEVPEGFTATVDPDRIALVVDVPITKAHLVSRSSIAASVDLQAVVNLISLHMPEDGSEYTLPVTIRVVDNNEALSGIDFTDIRYERSVKVTVHKMDEEP